jgi:hypothetical protein
MPMPPVADSLRWLTFRHLSSTTPLTLSGNRVSEYRDSRCQCTRDFQMSELRYGCHLSPTTLLGAHNFVYRDIAFRDIAVPGMTIPLSSETPKCTELRPLWILKHASSSRTIPISSKNRGSRFRCARVSCSRKPRCSGSRLPRISCQVSCRDQRLWFRRRFETREVSDLSTSESPMPSIPDDLAGLQPLHTRINPGATFVRSDGWRSFASSSHESQSIDFFSLGDFLVTNPPARPFNRGLKALPLLSFSTLILQRNFARTPCAQSFNNSPSVEPFRLCALSAAAVFNLLCSD